MSTLIKEEQKIKNTSEKPLNNQRPSIVINTKQSFPSLYKQNLRRIYKIIDFCVLLEASVYEQYVESCQIKNVSSNNYTLKLNINKFSNNLKLSQDFFYITNLNEVDISGRGTIHLKFNNLPEISEKYRFEGKLNIKEQNTKININTTGSVFTDSQNIFKLAKFLQININSYLNKKIVDLFDNILKN